MQNINESIDYTLEKKEYQIASLESNYSKSKEEINDFLDKKKSAVSVTIGFEDLSIWYHWNFINYSLKRNIINYEFLSHATLYGIDSNNVRFFLGKKVETYKQSIQFDKAIKHMAQALLLGWDTLAIKYGKMLIIMLYGKQYKGWHSVYKHTWFMLEIFCKWQNIQLDYSKLYYPEDMDIYQEVLDNWDTRDERLLAKLVNNISDFHIAQSDEYVTTDEYGNEQSADFSSSDYFIYAIEILLWLNNRCRMGLPDYIAGNELMQLPINNWHTQKMEVPYIILIEKAKAKLLDDYPGIEFEI